jgi:hypothetical protein
MVNKAWKPGWDFHRTRVCIADHKETQMEKLGVEKQQLLVELRSEYSVLRSKLNSMEKTGSAQASAALDREIAVVKAKIDEIETS